MDAKIAMIKQTGAIILAGGQGKRMGYVNKGFQILKGKNLISYVIASIQNQVSEVLISANADIIRYQQYGFQVCSDDERYKLHGPLAGIYSTAKHFSPLIKWVLVVPCDTPFLPSDLITKLFAELEQARDTQIAYVATATHQHFNIFLCDKNALSSLGNYLSITDNLSVQQWLNNQQSKAIFFADHHHFINLNDKQQLSRYEHLE